MPNPITVGTIESLWHPIRLPASDGLHLLSTCMTNAKLKSTADELRRIVADIVPQLHSIANEQELAVRPRPEKWSRQEILGHLIDSACNNQQKFVRMMQQPHLDFPGYAQDDWVLLQQWAKADFGSMITLWQSYNEHIAWLIESVNEDHLSNTITISGTGPFSLEFIMPDYVEHLKHHVKQILPDCDLQNSFENVYNA